MVSEAGLRAQYKYDKSNTQQVMLKLNRNTDADILMKLDSMENRQGYIKELVRKDMREEGEILSLDSIRFLVIPTAKKYRIDRVHLFGSYARAEAKPQSDVDLLIEGGDYHGLMQYAEMLESFEKALGKKVDLVTQLSLENPKRESARRFKENIGKDKVLLYESK